MSDFLGIYIKSVLCYSLGQIYVLSYQKVAKMRESISQTPK